MFIFLFILSIVICSLCYIFGIVKKGDNFSVVALILLFIFAISTIVSFMRIFDNIQTLGTAHTIDEKIEMYQEENAKIEQSIDNIVKSYMDFEAKTYTEIKDKNAIDLVSLFPELKSDELVQKQIKVYIKNQKKMKALKEEKIDVAKARWNLYFGE